MVFCAYLGRDCESLNQNVTIQHDLFFAYPSKPKLEMETIRNGIDKVKQSDKSLRINDWMNLDIEGQIIFCKICEAIKSSRCVAADVTSLNFNVIFELGFAIGSGIPIFPIVDQAVEEKHSLEYRRFNTISTIGYAKYENSKSLSEKILKKQPWLRTHLLLNNWADIDQQDANKILYLKSLRNTDASIRVSEFLDDVSLTTITDDPCESPGRALNWYINALSQSKGIISHLVTDDRPESILQNAKCSFFSGMAVALGKKVLLLTEPLLESPIDYKDLIKEYRSLKELSKILDDFQEDIIKTIREDFIPYSDKNNSILHQIDLGQHIAENEFSNIPDIFVATPLYDVCKKNKPTLVIGRRGTGKSALFYMLTAELSANKQNFICEINPKGYDLDKLIQFIKVNGEDVEEGYFIQSLWKLVLMSEMLSIAYNAVASKAIYASKSKAEKAIVEYVESVGFIREYRFTSRISSIFEELSSNGKVNSIMPISELLHETHLKQMKKLIINYASEKEGTYLLIDGLDNNWRVNDDMPIICDIVSGLVATTSDLWRDLQKSSMNKDKHGQIGIVTFLRTDIFSIITQNMSQKDKLAYEQLYWDDSNLLFYLIEKRIQRNTTLSTIGMKELWRELLEAGYGVEEFKSDVFNSIIKRPRDIVYFVSQAINKARFSGQQHITKSSIKKTRDDYSYFLLEGFISEAHCSISNMEGMFDRFNGKKRVLMYDEIKEIMSPYVSVFEEAMDYLILANFFGVEVSQGVFKFCEAPDDFNRLKKKAEVYSKENWGEKRFRIHKAFDFALDLKN